MQFTAHHVLNTGMALFSPDQSKLALQRINRSLIHFNARSIRKNNDYISTFLRSLEHSFSFICLSETWLCNDDALLYGFPHYQSEFCHRPSSSHGGAAIFISQLISYSRRLDIAINVTHCESVFIELDKSFIEGADKNFILGCIYRSPSSSVPEFLASLDAVFEKLSLENKNVVLVGDININLLDIDSKTPADYIACFSGFGYESLIQHPTRCTFLGPETLLDHAISNISPAPASGVVSVDITDHYPIFLTFSAVAAKSLPCFSTSVFNRDKFVEIVTSTDWSRIDALQDGGKAIEEFCNIIHNAISTSTSTVKCKKRYKYPGNPWVTQGLLRSMRKKENLYRKTKKKPFNSSLARRYQNYSKVLNNLLRAAKERYYVGEFNKNKNNPKKQWKLFNNFLNRSACNVPVSEVNYNGVIHKSGDVANAFCEYFFSLPKPQLSSSYSDIYRSSHTFYLSPVSPDEVYLTILGLKDTSAGLDNIRASHLKAVADVISSTLCIIINRIFEGGIFPQILKKAKIIPVFKKGDRLLISNYRPISILSSISKIIERLFVKRLNDFLAKYDLLKPNQFGFRAGSSTNLALLSLTDYIKKSIDSGLLVGSVFIDFTKAFDTINHNILFHKLDMYGIRGPALSFLRSYLINREGKVYNGEHSSDTKIINQGVPQGSIIGPLLFIIYINDIVDHLQSDHCVLYADDTTLSCAHKSLPPLVSLLNGVLTKAMDWCHKNHLIINPSKTKFMLFRSEQKRVSFKPAINLGTDTIHVSDHVIFLGVHLDSHLKFRNHFNYLRRKTAYGIRALIKARQFFPRHALLSLYFAFIHSHLIYGIVAWGNTYNCHITYVQHIQNQAIRIITNSSFYSSASTLLAQNNVLSVRKLFQYNIITLLFKLLTNQLLFHFIELSCLTNTNPTRFAANYNYLLPSVSTNYGKMTSHFSAISSWNSLPDAIKSLSSLSLFKKQLKEFLLQF